MNFRESIFSFRNAAIAAAFFSLCFTSPPHATVELAFRQLQDSCENELGLGCGYIGRESRNLTCLYEIITANRIYLLETSLYSKIPATRYLAAETLVYAAKERKHKVSVSARLKLDSLYSDSSVIPVCSGCTYRGSAKLNALLKNRNNRTGIKAMTMLRIKEAFRDARQQ